MNELERTKKKIKKYSKINKVIDRIIAIILVLCLAYIGFCIFDDYKFTHQDIEKIKYRNFDELRKINPDVCAWITIDDTRIDYPVVQGIDNFEYLDKSFEGEFYAGGAIFLDCENNKDFSDPYNIIHGHHITGGAMFGDITKFKDTDFFKEHKTGLLLTPKYDYKLKVMSYAEPGAYDSKIYAPKLGKKTAHAESERIAVHSRNLTLGKSQMLMLSTCSGEMNNNRVVLFCKMINIGRHQ